MAEKVGVLRMQPSGRWAVCRPGQEPLEITSGEPIARQSGRERVLPHPNLFPSAGEPPKPAVARSSFVKNGDAVAVR